MIKTIRNTGESGVIVDVTPDSIAENAWTDASNIRFIDGSAIQAFGYSEIYATPGVAPYHVFPVTIGGARYWVYVGAAKVYCVNGTTHTDLSPAGSYTGAANAWTSCVLGGIPLINAGNTIDLPQSWDLVLANNFGALANWPASTYCKALRAYRNYLVALGVTKSAISYPFMVKWSHPADPGAVPGSWDQTDATKDAGEFDLSEGQDVIVDGLQLRDSFMIYKESSIWRMNYVGGDYVMGFKKVVGQSGALSRNCITELDGVHVVMTGDDLIIHDGNQPTSVLDGVARKHLMSSIDSTNYATTFVVKNPYMSEVMVFYPNSSTLPNKALVWNYHNKTVSFRDFLDGVSITHASSGLVESGLSDTWASDPAPWDSDTTRWSQSDFTPSSSRVVLAGQSSTKLFLLDASSSWDGTQITANIERRGLNLDAPNKRKLIRSIRPRIYGNDGSTVTVSVGYADSPYDDPTYTSSTYTIGTTISCDFLVEGRYLAVKFANGTAYQWRLDSFDIEYEITGDW